MNSEEIIKKANIQSIADEGAKAKKYLQVIQVAKQLN